MPEFDRHPEEAKLVGKILAGYGELEFDLCHCVSRARQDFDMALKTMYRARGERQRIEIAEALGRKPFRDMKLGERFTEAISDTHECRKIRNRYAHCHWVGSPSLPLGFVELEQIAKERKPADLRNLTTRYVDLDLLIQQLEYFSYVDQCILYLTFEAQKRLGAIKVQPIPIPTKIPRPPAYI